MWGRLHGAAFYLDSKWVVLRRSTCAKTEDRLSFASSFNAVQVAAGLRKAHDDIPLRWLREMFGSTKRLGGKNVPSHQHTTIHSHKTDACATCGFFLADLRQAQQTLKRHCQQADQGSMDRQSAIKETRRLIGDLQAAVAEHKNGASSALEYQNKCIGEAAQRYEELSTVFEEVVSNEPTKEETGGITLTPQEELMCVQAFMSWYEDSSDYPQDKAVPTWNPSPQPGPTYL